MNSLHNGLGQPTQNQSAFFGNPTQMGIVAQNLASNSAQKNQSKGYGVAQYQYQVQFSPNNMGMLIGQIGQQQQMSGRRQQSLPRISNNSQQNNGQPIKTLNTINMNVSALNNQNLNTQYNQLIYQKQVANNLNMVNPKFERSSNSQNQQVSPIQISEGYRNSNYQYQQVQGQYQGFPISTHKKIKSRSVKPQYANQNKNLKMSRTALNQNKDHQIRQNSSSQNYQNGGSVFGTQKDKFVPAQKIPIYSGINTQNKFNENSYQMQPMSGDSIKKRKNNYLAQQQPPSNYDNSTAAEEQKVTNSDYIQVQNHEEEFEDEDDDFFEANDKDLIDKNFQEKENYGDDDDDDDEQDPDQNEDMQDIDQSSQENDEQPQQQEQQSQKQPVIEIEMPEKPLDEKKFKDELERYDPNNVADLMFARKERKIPGSVMKPHCPYANLVQSNAIKGLNKNVRVFFPYPQYCHRIKIQDSFLQCVDRSSEIRQGLFNQQIKPVHQYKMMEKNMTLGFKVHDSTHIYNSVVNTMKAAGVRIVPPSSSKWNVLWTGLCKPEQLKDATKYQKINHFPNSFQLGRKDLMWKNIQRASKMFQGSGEFYFCPKTYIFPDDYRKFCIERESSNNKHMYIMKPSASSCGKGIKVVGPKTQVSKKGGYVVSQYISNPHLIDGYKYDLRIYVVVTCFEPLKIFLFREGLVRFATQKYTNNPKMLEKRFIHLTNYSINKRADDYVKAEGNAESQEDASKWNLMQLKNFFQKNGINYSQVFNRIKDVVIKTCIAHEPQITSSYSRCNKNRNVCFEIYGFDILLDQKLRPHLLEINISPSLSSSSPLDKKIKTMLIVDTLNLIGVQPYDRKLHEKEMENVLKKRLLGLDKNTTQYKLQQQQKISEQYNTGGISPIKNANGTFIYSKDKKINSLLNALSAPGTQEHFKNADGVFSAPIPHNNENLGLSEDDLNIIIDYEEENLRLGNFERIFPLQSNAQHYSKFFEYERPTNELLSRYLRITQGSINPAAMTKSRETPDVPNVITKNELKK